MIERVIPVRALEIGASGPSERAAPRHVDGLALDQIRCLLGDVKQHADLLIEHLHTIQDRFGHLSTMHLAALAQEMGLAPRQVLEVASSYHHFDVVKAGEPAPPVLTVRVCDGLSCEMAGRREMWGSLPLQFGKPVRVLAVPCLGRCDEAPVALLGQNPIAPASRESAAAAVRDGTRGSRARQLLGYLDYAEYRAAGGYRLLQQCMSGAREVESVLRALDDSGLRCAAGEGSAAGRKWRLLRAESGPRLMAVDINEGEPGAFKDRVLLERDPHRFLEGMLIAAWATGIEEIYLYLRDDYDGCRELLGLELETLQMELPIANLPQVYLRRAAGPSICGRGSTMIGSIEGRPALPRPHPAEGARPGLFGRPTLDHDLETLFWVREVLEKGGAWFAALGRRGRRGLRFFSVSGRVRSPGVKRAPVGITIEELIDEHCGGMQTGHTLYGYLPGGASGCILPGAMGSVPLDFDAFDPLGGFAGSAAVVVLSDHDTAAAAARSTMRFLEQASCKSCAPCRNGAARVSALLEEPTWDLRRLSRVLKVMREESTCALCPSAANSVDCVARYFPGEPAVS
jgi:NADH:ubiquinone oxidoreductase subunit F (NADH-binding)/NADH:ubiquinone oxidoreductase subunit E